MELIKLEKLLELTTKYGVRRLRTSEVEIELGPSTQQASILPVLPTKEQISDQDMLFWSVEAPAEEKKAS